MLPAAVSRHAVVKLWLFYRFLQKANLLACFTENRLKLFRLACTFEQWNAKVIWHRWWISILSDWSWQTPSHQAHLDGQHIGGHFALIRWLRHHRNGEEANDNGEEGIKAREVQLGLIHQLSQRKQKCVQLASPIIRWLLLHYMRWHTTFSLMALHRGGTTAIAVCLSLHWWGIITQGILLRTKNVDIHHKIKYKTNKTLF